jgi:hypothetical protein
LKLEKLSNVKRRYIMKNVANFCIFKCGTKRRHGRSFLIKIPSKFAINFHAFSGQKVAPNKKAKLVMRHPLGSICV